VKLSSRHLVYACPSCNNNICTYLTEYEAIQCYLQNFSVCKPHANMLILIFGLAKYFSSKLLSTSDAFVDTGKEVDKTCLILFQNIRTGSSYSHITGTG
jgi:hypothetical protein